MTEDMPETVTLEWLGGHILAQRTGVARWLDAIETGLDGIRDDIKMLTGAVMYRAGDEMVGVSLIGKVQQLRQQHEALDGRVARLEQSKP